MNTSEFSNEFDALLNSHSVLKPFGFTQPPIELDEYEKSVLLTEAQELLIKELYRGTLTGGSFEKTEEIRRSLDSLVKTVKPKPAAIQAGLSKSSVIYELPEDTWFITYESAILDDEDAGCMNGQEVQVIPMTQDEYHRASRNPFRRPSKRRVIRLDSGASLVEIISDFKLGDYIVRYISRPKPIILADLDGLSITKPEYNTTRECELNSVTHRAILERAVQLALSRVPQTGK